MVQVYERLVYPGPGTQNAHGGALRPEISISRTSRTVMPSGALSPKFARSEFHVQRARVSMAWPLLSPPEAAHLIREFSEKALAGARAIYIVPDDEGTPMLVRFEQAPNVERLSPRAFRVTLSFVEVV